MSRYSESKKMRGDSRYTKHLVRGSFMGEFNPAAGQNRITFALPNFTNEFLQCSELFLEGEVLVTATNTAAQAHTVIIPRIPDAQLILDRFDLTTGGQVLEQSLNCNINMIHKCVQGSGFLENQLASNLMGTLQDEDLQYSQFSTVSYVTPPSYRKFRIRFQNKPTEIFGPSREGDLRTEIMLPLFMMPKTELNVYFRLPEFVIRTDPGANPAGLVTNYLLNNMRLACSYIQSPKLMAQFSGGFSTTFESHAHVPMAIQPTSALTKISLSLPSSYESVNHVLGRLIINSVIRDTQFEDRLKKSSTEPHTPITANIRLNGRNRYIEDLNWIGLLQELNLIYPDSIKSKYIMLQDVFQKRYTFDNHIWALLCGSDHFDGKSVTGFKSSQSVGGIIPEFTYEQAITSPSTMEIWISHMRAFTCTPSGMCTIRY